MRLSLTATEEAEIEHLLHTANGHLVQRCRIVLASAADESPAAAIAQRIGVSTATVRRWQVQFRKSGVAGLLDAPRRGAPRQISATIRHSVETLHQQGESTRRIARETGISQSSVARILGEEAVGEREEERGRHAAPGELLPEGLVLSLFESLGDKRPLASFLARLKEATRSDFGAFLVFSGRERRPTLILTEEELLHGTTLYVEKYYQKEIMFDLPEGVVTTASEWVPHGRIMETELYHEFLKPLGIGHVIGVDLRARHGISGSLRLSRLETAGDYGHHSRTLLTQLIPYLRSALDLFVQHAETETEKQALASTISGMSLGSIQLAPDSGILAASPPARAMLAKKDGLAVVGGRLTLASQREGKRLAALVRHNALASVDPAHPAKIRAMRVERPSGKESFTLLIRPLGTPSPKGESSQPFSIRPTAMLYLVDPAAPQKGTAAALAELFALTPAEARLALALVSGLSVKAIAGQHATSVNTVRSQLRSIFAKVGVTRQSELIRTLFVSVALLAIGEAP